MIDCATALAIAGDLKSRYFFAIDNKQWDVLRGLFSPDAVFAGFAFESAGVEEFIEGSRQLLEGADSVHEGSMPLVEPISDTLLRARWSMHDELNWSPGSRSFRGDTSHELSGIRGWGYYEEEYRHDDSGWTISMMRLSRLRVELVHGEVSPVVKEELTKPLLDWL